MYVCILPVCRKCVVPPCITAPSHSLPLPPRPFHFTRVGFFGYFFLLYSIFSSFFFLFERLVRTWTSFFHLFNSFLHFFFFQPVVWPALLAKVRPICVCGKHALLGAAGAVEGRSAGAPRGSQAGARRSVLREVNDQPYTSTRVQTVARV